MKRRPEISQGRFDAEAFIQGAPLAPPAAPQGEAPPPLPAKRSESSKLAAAGFIRTSFDFREDLYERMKIAAVRERRPMRHLVEEAVTAWLDQKGL